MTKPVGFGILGCGRITRGGLIPGIVQSPGAKRRLTISLRVHRTGPRMRWKPILRFLRSSARRSGRHGGLHSFDRRIAYDGHRGRQAGIATVLCEKSLTLVLAGAEEMAAACHQQASVLQKLHVAASSADQACQRTVEGRRDRRPAPDLRAFFIRHRSGRLAA